MAARPPENSRSLVRGEPVEATKGDGGHHHRSSQSWGLLMAPLALTDYSQCINGRGPDMGNETSFAIEPHGRPTSSVPPRTISLRLRIWGSGVRISSGAPA